MKKIFRKRIFRPVLSTILALAMGYAQAGSFEVWAIDQSDTETGGAKLYIFDGPSLAGNCDAEPEVVDLAALGEQYDQRSGIRPHMVHFNTAHTHALISHTGTETLYIMDAANRTLVANLPLTSHGVNTSPDSTMALSLELGAKNITRIWTDYANDVYSYGKEDELSLVPYEVQTGGDAKPVCAEFTADSRNAYVTLSGGGLLVLDVKSTPMVVVDLYTKDEVKPIGCGTLRSEDGSKMYTDSGTPNPFDPEYLYVFDTTKIRQTPLPKEIKLPGNDSHSPFFTNQGRYLWVSMRASNEFVIVDTEIDEVVNTVPATLDDDPELDAAPDVSDISPRGNRAFVALRGPRPRTANKEPFNNAVGNSPGVGVIQITRAGGDGKFRCIAPIRTGVDENGVEQSDIHGLRVRLK